MSQSGRLEQPYLDTPRGILSPGGLMFHTTVADLEDQYGEVLRKVPLAKLIDRAELWLTSHRAIALWALVPLLVWLSVPAACILGLIVFVGWKLLAPAMGNAHLEVAIRLLSSVAGQLVVYVVGMSWIGAQRNYPALTAGLVAFVLIRWQLLDYVLSPLTRYLWKRLYPLPVADQMLRALIHTTALKLKISLPQFPSIARWMQADDDDEAD